MLLPPREDSLRRLSIGIPMSFTSEQAREWTIQAIGTYGPKVLTAGIILVITWFVARLARGSVLKILTKAKLEASLSKFFSRLVYLACLGLGVVIGLQQLGVETTSIIAILGAASLAVGLALQDSLSNFAAGVTILVLRPFRVGDYIAGSGVEGTVKDINLFSTELSTVENLKIVVPNSKLSTDVVKNYSSNPTRRIDLVIGISYDSPIDKAKSVLEDILKNEKKVLNDPKWLIAVSELAESSVNLVLRVWVKNADYWDIRFHLLNEIKDQFDAKGIEIPFPHTVVKLQEEAKTQINE